MAIGNHKVEIVVGVRDLATRGLQNISRQFSGLHGSTRNFGSNFNNLNRMLDTSISKLDKAANSMYKFNMYTADLGRSIKNIGLVGGAAGALVAGQGVNNALQFDYKTHIMQSRMQVPDSVRKDIEDYILNDLNLQVGFSPTQIADTGIILGQAGINNTGDMKSLLKTTTYFSEAVDAAPDQAAEMIVSAAKGFGISMDNAGQITDKLTVALNGSLLHVEEMPHAIGELAGRAKMYGQSLDSSLVALMTMRDQGMSAAQGSQDLLHALRQGSRAGNDDVLFARTKSYFDGLGIDEGIFDADTRKLKEFPELISDIEQAMVKNGFSNPKYNINSTDEYYKYLEKNGGKAPDDFWDSMKAMPLITRIFGAAGQAPILMGMQTKYEEIDEKTGEKTGEVYYGSEALKRMQQNVTNSEGQVQATHDIVADSAQFQLEILSGAWQATQVKFLDGFLPAIKTASEELTSFLNPNSKDGPEKERGLYEYGPGEEPLKGLDKFDYVVQQTSDKFREEGNTTTADYIDTIGTGISNTARIGKTMPSMFGQISDSFMENIVKADWGSNIIEFPFHIIENGVKFIQDIVKGNEEFQKAVEALPKDLQDPAKLIETVTKGAVVLMVSKAIVRVIELGVRGVSTLLKGGKLASELFTTIKKAFGGDGSTSSRTNTPGGAGTYNIKANIVNVYGPNGGGANGSRNGNGNSGSGGNTVAGGTTGSRRGNNGDSGDGNSTRSGRNAGRTSTAGKIGKGIMGVGAITGIGMVTNDIYNGVTGGDSIIKSLVQSKFNPLFNDTNKKVEEVGNKVDAVRKVQEDKSSVGSAETKNTAMLVPGQTQYKEPPKIEVKVPEIKIPEIKIPTSYLQSQNHKPRNNQEHNLQRQERVLQKQLQANTQSIADEAARGATTVNNSVVSGFNVANSRLQNMNVQNSVNVAMPAAQVHISGNVKEHISQVRVNPINQTFQQQSSNMTRAQKILARRIGM